jgi:ubiquitin carboxyl-terminal hydrolase 4/11
MVVGHIFRFLVSLQPLIFGDFFEIAEKKKKKKKKKKAIRMENVNLESSGDNDDAATTTKDVALASDDDDGNDDDVQVSIPSAAEQARIVKELSAASSLKVNDKWYIVSSKWWQMWQDYASAAKEGDAADDAQASGEKNVENRNLRKSAAVEMPGEMDNAELLEDVEDSSTLLKTLQIGLDYVVHPASVWRVLEQWYGGGPVVERTVIQVGEFNPILRVDLYPVTLCFEKANTGREPTHVLRFARQTSIRQARQRICQRFYVPPHRSRLWIKFVDLDAGGCEYVLIEADEEDRSLEEHGIDEAALMVLETMDHEGAWRSNVASSHSESDDDAAEIELDSMQPMEMRRAGVGSSYGYTSLSAASSSSSSGSAYSSAYRSVASSASSWRSRNTEGKPAAPGAVGLVNLGNTCFMNSALQCLANTRDLTNYFVAGLHEAEVNPDNPLGMKGLVAQRYASLVQDMFSDKYSVISPVDFKVTIGKFQPQFSGYAQQDSQELIAFLLDGLHEDLNRVTDKPPTQQIESDGRDDSIVADLSWENHRLRHRSVIADLFLGQYKSCVRCPREACSRVSITFDPFMYLSVPLPVKATRTVRISLLRFNSTEPRERLIVTVPKQGPMLELRKRVAELVGIEPSRLLLGDIYSHRVYSFRDDSRNIASILDSDTTWALELEQQEESSDDEEEEEEKEGDGGNDDDESAVPANDDDNDDDVDKGKGKQKAGEKTSKYVRFQVVHRYTKEVRYTSGAVHQAKTMFSKPIVMCIEASKATNRNVLDMIASYLNARALGEPYSFARDDEKKAADDDDDDDGEKKDVGADADDKEEPMFQVFTGSAYNGQAAKDVLDYSDEPFACTDFLRQVVVLHWTDAKQALDADKRLAEETLHESARDALRQSDSAQSAIKLEQCIDLFTAQEKLSKEDMWYCNSCQDFVEATKQIDVWKLPKYVIVHLKRFQYTSTYRDRIDDLVEFPLESLDLSAFVKGPQVQNMPLYDLYAVSNHSGGMGGGHYTAYVRNNATNQWYNCNDSSVSPCSTSSIVSTRAYLLFYEAREPGQSAPAVQEQEAEKGKEEQQDDGDKSVDVDDDGDVDDE